MLWRCRCQMGNCEAIRHNGQIKDARFGVGSRVSGSGEITVEGTLQIYWLSSGTVDSQSSIVGCHPYD